MLIKATGSFEILVDEYDRLLEIGVRNMNDLPEWALESPAFRWDLSLRKLKREVLLLSVEISYRQRMFARWEGVDNDLANKFKLSSLRRQRDLLLEAQYANFDYIEARTWMNINM